MMYGLINTAKLNVLLPEAYLGQVLSVINIRSPGHMNCCRGVSRE